ncbi:hypothetical protein QQP08_016330 [Theobroma cacao]|nr:hypothetical protein QQP08_016330 [Theobroma cacao]
MKEQFTVVSDPHPGPILLTNLYIAGKPPPTTSGCGKFSTPGVYFQLVLKALEAIGFSCKFSISLAMITLVMLPKHHFCSTA